MRHVARPAAGEASVLVNVCEYKREVGFRNKILTVLTQFFLKFSLQLYFKLNVFKWFNK